MNNHLRKVCITVLLIFLSLIATGCMSNASKYQKALEILSTGDYTGAIAAFEELSGYEESGKYLMYARSMKLAEESNFELAINSFASLNEFHDSALQVTYYTARWAEAEQRYEDADSLYRTIITFRDSMERAAKLPDMILDRDFALARQVMLGEINEQDIDLDVRMLFSKVYSDSPTKMFDQFDQLGADALAAGQYSSAETIFAWLNEINYEGAALRIQDALFAQAKQHIDAGNYRNALAQLDSLYAEEYPLAKDALIECCYQLGMQAEAAENYPSAYSWYIKVQSLDSNNIAERISHIEHILEASYNEAAQLLAQGDISGAYTAFNRISVYKDATSQANAALAAIREISSARIATSGYHTVGLKDDGTVIAIGYNLHNQCRVTTWRDIVAVATASSHTVGLKADGTVVIAGSADSDRDIVNEWRDIVAVAADMHIIGLKSNGTVVAAGYNGDGQCNVSGWNNIVAIAAGGNHTVGLKADGTVVAAGDNSHGQCSMKEWSNIIAIAAGECHTVGLKADGTVVATGFNKQEQCNVSEWSDIVAIAAGGFHTVGLKADGTIVTAGGTFSSFNFTASLWRNIVAIAVGGHNTVGLKADGTVVAVGFDEYGQCDIGEWNLFK